MRCPAEQRPRCGRRRGRSTKAPLAPPTWLHLLGEPVPQARARDRASAERAPPTPAPASPAKQRSPDALRRTVDQMYRADPVIMPVAMGKVVELETPRTRVARISEPKRSQTPLQDRARSGRRRVHRRRLRDRRAARARPAGRQPHDQPVRRLRRHERRRLRRQHGRERRSPPRR